MNKNNINLKASLINSPLGTLLAIADTKALHSLKFVDSHDLESESNRVSLGTTSILESIKQELDLYFKGALKEFKTPLYFSGTVFQQSVWNILRSIKYAQVTSYSKQADLLGNKAACRAVANANGANPFVIIIPCHRVVRNSGGLGGYRYGISRKQWLLDFESKHI